MPAKRAKRLLRVVVWLIVIVLLLAVSLPLWFPWLLRPVAGRFGATFQSYERLSYSRFAVAGVLYSNRNVRVAAQRLEVSPWAGRAAAEDWSVTVIPRPARPSTNAPASVYGVYQQVSRIVSEVRRWIPQASLTNGYVRAPKVTIQIPGVLWQGPEFFGQAQISNALPLTIVRAKLPVYLELTTPSLELESALTISNAPNGLFIRGSNKWRTNTFAVDVAFGTTGSMPETARVTGRGVTFPPVKGDVSFDWDRDRYVLQAKGQMVKEPVAFDLRASGDPKSARLESAMISLPWGTARLEAGVLLQYSQPLLKTNALFAVDVDLARQPWIAAQGRLSGRVTVHPSRIAEFSLAGRNLTAANVSGSAAKLSGSISNLVHRGTIALEGMAAPSLKPMDVVVNWSGERLNLEQIQVKLAAGQSSVSAAGAADLKQKHFRIADLVVGANRIDLNADVQWPDRATVRASITNLTSGPLRDFVDLPYEDVFLDRLRLAAEWDHSPLTGALDFAGRTVLKDGTQLGAQGSLAANSGSLLVTNVVLTRNHEPVSAASGVLPVSIVPTNRGFVVPLPDGALQVVATADRQAFFWRLIEQQAGCLFSEPELSVELAGTWRQPKGRLSLRAAQMRFRGAKPEVPPFEGLSLVAHVHETAAQIEFLNFFVANQPVTFSAAMPLPENFWIAPRKSAPQLDWRNISCRLKIDSAQIAAFTPILPAFLIPQGTINADFGLVKGGNLDGLLRLDGAGTRPIEGLGALQDIEILCRFSEDKAQINSYTALGGYSVLGAGAVQLDANRLRRGELPPFEFHLTGENIPLTRQVDAVVRADLDATIKHVATQPVVVSGTLNLRDSLYLRELRDLVPGKLASVGRRPPYFSIETKPFADWRLDLTAAGHRFLKVRTPIFNGEISAGFKMSGTLGNPIAIGDVTINAGIVRFPFGNIPINQGLVSLTSENPFRPQLLINGNDRVLGYDINMEVTGYADTPVLQFSSTPPLSSEQILLMLTAGEIPRQGQFAFSAEQRAQRLALFLGRGVLSDFGLGGDSNRLTIRSGENISETGRPTYSVEYELTDDWSVIGQYDQFNDFNLMLKWRVYSR